MVSKFSTFGLVIEKYDNVNNKIVTELDLLKYLQRSNCYIYWSFILHDSDINEYGELEREHYHVVVKLSSQYACKTIIHDFAKELMINVNCISCKGVADFIKIVQYHVHKNNSEKVQYNLYDIYTNDLDDTISIITDNVSCYDISIDYLIDLVHSRTSITDIYKELGMKQVRLYRPIIQDLWKERFKR